MRSQTSRDIDQHIHRQHKQISTTKLAIKSVSEKTSMHFITTALIDANDPAPLAHDQRMTQKAKYAQFFLLG
jgi:hypothetical protein